MNRRLCWLWRGRSLLFPCSHECGSFQETQCRLSALLSQMKALLGSVKCRLYTQHLRSFRSIPGNWTRARSLPFCLARLWLLGCPGAVGSGCVWTEGYTPGKGLRALYKVVRRVLPKDDADLWLCFQMLGPDPQPMELCFAKCCNEGWPALHTGRKTELLIKPGFYHLIGFLTQRCRFCFIVGYGLVWYMPTFFIAEIWPRLRLRHFFSSLLLVSCCNRFLHLVLVTQQTSIVLDALVSQVIIARVLQNAPSPASCDGFCLMQYCTFCVLAQHFANYPACFAVCILLTLLLLSLVLNAQLPVWVN